MAKAKGDFSILTRLMIIVFSLGIIMIAVYPHRKEIKSKLIESKSELKENYPLMFGDSGKKTTSPNSYLKQDGNKLLMQTPANETNKVVKAKTTKKLDNLSSKDRDELDNLINQK